MTSIMNRVVRLAGALIGDEAGATAIEYGLLAALLGTAIITSVSGLGNQMKTTFNTTSSAMSSANAAA